MSSTFWDDFLVWYGWQRIVTTPLTTLFLKAVLSLDENPLTRNLRNYRKVVIGKCYKLTALDKKPITDNERKRAEAWWVPALNIHSTHRLKITLY